MGLSERRVKTAIHRGSRYQTEQVQKVTTGGPTTQDV